MAFGRTLLLICIAVGLEFFPVSADAVTPCVELGSAPLAGIRVETKALLDVAHDGPLQVAPLLLDDPYGIPGRLGVEARMNAQGSAGGTLGAYRGAQHFSLPMPMEVWSTRQPPPWRLNSSAS